MAPVNKTRKSQMQTAEKLPQASAPKRIKTETIPGNADAVTRAASALDLASDSIPENLRCPICMEIPLAEVLQCPNGHTICKDCQEKSGKVASSQCNKAMKTGDGDWIRNRFMEQYGSHWFLCPFRKNGCQEVLSREDLRKHMIDCIYDGKHVQICKYFDESGLNCQYWTHILKPTETLSHLFDHIYSLDAITWKEDMSFWFPVNPMQIFDYVKLAGIRLKDDTVLAIFGWNMKAAGQLSFVCLDMSDKARPGPVRPKLVKLTFENQKLDSNGVPDMSLTLPVVSLASRGN